MISNKRSGKLGPVSLRSPSLNAANVNFLKGKTILITGCEGQLGQAYIAKLLERGHKIIGFDLASEAKNKQIIYKKVDVSNMAEIKTAIGEIDEDIDVLINNAGTAVFTPFEERTEEELDRVIGVNIKGAIVMTQQVFNKFFKPKKSGCIVNIGSIYGVVAGDMRIYHNGDRQTSEIYGASKAATISITKYFSAYMAPYHVRVNCISPGGVFNNHEKVFVDAYSRKVPMGRMADKDDFFSTLEYLISDDSSYLTGQNIVVDGGLTAW